MGYGLSIWRMDPKLSKLKGGEKECRLCLKAAVDGDDLCEEHLNGIGAKTCRICGKQECRHDK